MITRILGLCPWAEAGTLAIVVAAHNTTRAPQIALNMLIAVFLNGGRRTRAAAFARLDPVLGRDLGEWKFVEAPRKRCAGSAIMASKVHRDRTHMRELKLNFDLVVLISCRHRGVIDTIPAQRPQSIRPQTKPETAAPIC